MPIVPPPVVALLNPERSLVVCFTDIGTVTVSRRVQDAAGNYVATKLGELAQVTTRLGFTVTVDDPGIGLLVETDGIWLMPWDEDRVSALGAPAFAFGNGPIGVPGAHSSTIRTSRTREGIFTTTGTSSTLEFTGKHYKTKCDIPAGVPKKYLSLWLPAGSTGSVTFKNWGGPGISQVYDSV